MSEGAPAHHKHGPSSLTYKQVCPGYVKSSGDNAFTKEGKYLHSVLEQVFLTRNPDVSHVENPDHRRWLEACIGYVTPLVAKATHIRVEVKLVILGGKTFGTADLLIYRQTPHGLHCDVVDWKFGLDPVHEASTNLQGYSYVSGAHTLTPNVATFTIHFVQPKLERISYHTFRATDVPRLNAILRRTLDRCETWDATHDVSMLRVSDIVCARCDAIKDCKLFAGLAVQVHEKYTELEVPVETHCSKIESPAQACKVWPVVSAMKKWAETSETHLKNLALANDGLRDEDGKLRYKIGHRRGTFSLTNIPIAYGILKEYMDAEQIAMCGDIDFGKVCDAIRDNTARGHKAKVVAELQQKLLDAGAARESDGSVTVSKVRE